MYAHYICLLEYYIFALLYNPSRRKEFTANDVCTWVYAYLLQPLVKYSQVTRDNGCDFVLSVLHIYREVVQKGVRLKETMVAAAKNRSWEGLCRTLDRLGNNS